MPTGQVNSIRPSSLASPENIVLEKPNWPLLLPSRLEGFSLAAGAALGVALALAVRTDPMNQPGDWWRYVAFLFYSAITGLTLPAVLWLAYYRRTQGRRGGPGAAALAMTGIVTGVFFPLVASSSEVFVFYSQPHSWYESARQFPPLEAEMLTAFYQCWPFTCLALALACCLSGQRIRWWPEWLGILVACAWSLPAILAVYHICGHLFWYDRLPWR